MNERDKAIALFRTMVLGPLASRAQLTHGEIKKITSELSNKTYRIPNSKRCYLSQKTIERWYYSWRRGGFDALIPKRRSDEGRTCIEASVQDIILALKKENPSRSLNTLKYLLESKGVVSKNKISRPSLHRFLQKKRAIKTNDLRFKNH